MTSTAPAAAPAVQYAAEPFLYHEAAPLDGWLLDEWFVLMHPDVRYRVPTPGSDQLDPRYTLQVIHDDHTRLGGRVRRLRSKHAQAESPHSRTRRPVTNVRAADQGDRIDVRANFQVMRTRLGQLDHFLGAYRHLLVRAGESFLIRERIAGLDHGIVEAGGTVSIIL